MKPAPEKIIVQIYEIQTPEEAEKLIEMGVDHIGSVILSQDHWKVPSIKRVMDIVARSKSRSSLIPLYNQPDVIFKTIDYYQPDMIHFCEDLTDASRIFVLKELQERVKQRFSETRIVRSIPIPQSGMTCDVESLELAKLFEPVSDYFLTDTLIVKKARIISDDQPVQGFVGITGKTCDWDIAANLVKQSRIPVILAGGIHPDNVKDGIQRTRPAGIDSCTGTNARDHNGLPIRFKKDMDKVRQLVERVKGLE